MTITGKIMEESAANYVRFDVNGVDHVTFSGVIGVWARGNDDDHFNEEHCELVVGPWWRAVRGATPSLNIGFWSHEGSDSDDNSGFAISDVRWDTVGGTGGHANDERLRIKCDVSVKGEGAKVVALGYLAHVQGALAEEWHPSREDNDSDDKRGRR